MNQSTLARSIGCNSAYNNKLFKDYLLNDHEYQIPFETFYFEANRYLIEEEQIVDSLYIIASGVVIEKQADTIRCFLGREEYIGTELLFYDKAKTIYSLMTLTKVKVYKISFQSIREKLKQKPIGYLSLNEVLVHKIILLTNRLVSADNSYEKILQLLEYFATIYGKEKNNTIYIRKFFTKKMIASYLHVSYATVVSICKRLVVDGILHDEPHGMILYPANM
ncbi:Crp/Fnr family transcriptional regulator [Listeria seeligeri]|uniref:Crp/Fnr family transcriptional regulator n=1 Tax=Listeria seeligeri TaxID=1640 RepID=UPI0019430DB6|nr:Crp/Fnr family transcriptional regulator [Listeria seeligeri]MBM5598035.1 Crp/Fnr family transcriptional regulator [Listeria seeligeri]